MQLLLDRGADINAQGGKYGNALEAASVQARWPWICDYVELVQILLNAGANINAQGGLYGHALRAARSEHRNEVSQLLRDRGAFIEVEESSDVD